MALAPADFYAYSQATGIPVPESPQERANLAPEVLNFRRNQLKAPQAEQGGPDPLSLGIGIGLGLAGIGGVAYGAKRFLGGRQRIPKAPPTSANAGTVVQDFDKAGLEKIVNKNVSEAVAEQKRRSAVYQNVAAKPKQDLKPVYKPSADASVELITDPNTGEIFARGRSPKSFNQLYTSLQTEQAPVASKPSPVNTDIYYEENKPAKSFAEEYISSSPKILSQLQARAAEEIRLQDPVLGDPEWKALINRQTLQEKGELGREAQRQMRVAKQLENEANEFLEQLKQESLSSQAIAAVGSGEDQMTGRVMRSIQRNEDLDVSEVNAAARQTGSVYAAAAATSDGIPFDQTEINQPITAQELANQAKEEMLARREILASVGYTPAILKKGIKATGYKPGTIAFERALAQPFRTSSSTSVTGTKPIEFSLPEGPIRRTVQAAGAQEPLIEKSVLNIGPEAVTTSTAAGTAIRGASPVYHEAMPKESTRQLYGTPDVLVPGAPDELGPDLPGSLRVSGGITPDVEPQFLSKQEITYSSLDRPQVPGPTGGSAGIGVYGIESSYVPGAMSKVTGGYSAASSRKPTDTPAWIQKRDSKSGFEALTTPQLVSAAEKAQAPRIKSAFEKEIARRDITKQSLEASEIARRAIIEGRDPQAILRQRGFNV